MNVKSWWRGLPGRRRAMFLVTLVVFALIAVAALIGWGRALLAPDADPGADPGRAGASSEPATGGDGAQAAEGESEPVAGGGFEFDVDENGMVVMPVTTDPREAAAGAAAVAFSVEFGELSREEFLDAAIARMTQPSEEYVGPGTEIHTLVESGPFEDTVFHSLPPAEVLQLQVDYWGQFDNPERYTWWTLANGAIYDNFALLPDHFWRAHTEMVLDEAEISAVDPSLVPNFPTGTDLTPETPGASLTQWWVLSDVENSQVGSADASTLKPAHFAIWCDAPEDGGLCGVAFTLDTSFPAVWPRQ